MERVFTKIAYVGTVLLAILGLWFVIDGAIEAGIFTLVGAAIVLIMCLATTSIYRSRGM
jgi:hypothetical protein